MNFPARILTREHHNMNLPAHIITCSSLVMNLPAHDNIKHIQIRTNTISHAKHITNEPCHCTIAWHNLSATRRNGSADCLAVPQHYCVSRHTKLPYFWLLSSGSLYIVRSYTSNVTLLVLGILTQFLASNKSILKHPGTKICIHILHILKFTTS